MMPDSDREVFCGEKARGALFASSVSLTSPLRSEVPGKTKVATSISRSIPFRPAPSRPHVSGRNADASKSGRILRFSRRSTGCEKPPRPLPHHSGGARRRAEPQPARTIYYSHHHSKNSSPNRIQIVRFFAVYIRMDIRRNAVPKSQTDIAMLIRRNGECWL